MTLFDLAKKNIKGNFQSYFVYFISMFFSIMIFYTFTSLQYSTEIAKAIESSDSMWSVFMVASVVLVLFVGVFILYSNQFFARKRKKEAGLYALLGLPKRTIGKMLFYENMLIGGIVLLLAVAAGTLLSKLFGMIMARLLGIDVEVGMVFSVPALLSTVVVFMALTLITSLQAYRLIYRFPLIELFRAEQEGEVEPRASVVSALAAVLLLATGYAFGFRELEDNGQILTNLGVMTAGIVLGTAFLFSSLVLFLLRFAKRRKRYYYKGMNLVSTSNLMYRIKGNARTLSVISILSALALCAFSFGFSAYYSHEQSARLVAPFSYMFASQGEEADNRLDAIIHGDQAHPVLAQLTIPVAMLEGFSTSDKIMSKEQLGASERPIQVVSRSAYNRAAQALNVEQLEWASPDRAIAIRPMYTEYGWSDYEGESVTLELADRQITLGFAGLTKERIVNWSYPDIMIVVADEIYEGIVQQSAPVHYVGYVVENQKTTKETAYALAAAAEPESKLSTYYTEYRLGIENAAFNVFILGFLGLVFLMATGSVLYFKQLTEAANDQSRYAILKRIGVSRKEIGGSILKQNAWIFLLPLLVGLGHYIVIFGWLKRLFGGLGGVSLLVPILICVTMFMAIYAFYYVLTVNSISKLLIGESTRAIRLAVVVIAVCLLAVVGMLLWSSPPAQEDEAGGEQALQLAVPEPTGDYLVGATELHLADAGRVDPWTGESPRELMLTLWYPAERESTRKIWYMREGAAKYYDETVIPTIGLQPGTVDLAEIETHAWLDAPVASNEGGWPVVLYSPGASVPRTFGTFLAQELASRGYVVVTVDHPNETSVVEFPDGRIVTEQLPKFSAKTVIKLLEVRVDDVRYVLDQLAELGTGNNPDAGQKRLPDGLAEALDLSLVGIFGHSAGGATAAQAMYEDERFDAGIDMDGTMGHMPDHPLPVAQHGLERPFLLMNSGFNDEGEVDSHLTAEDRGMFWRQSSGWKLDVSIPNGAHFTYTDYQYLLPQLAGKVGLSRLVQQQSIGTADPAQALKAQREYVAAFFDRHLKELPRPLLEEVPSPYDAVVIVE